MIKTVVTIFLLLGGLVSWAAELALKDLPSESGLKAELSVQGGYAWQALPNPVTILPVQLFELIIPDHPSITKKIKFLQTQGKRWLQDCLNNSFFYKDFIMQQLEAYQVPSELFFLAAVESSFRASAVSKAGAVGLWQFMENSVRGYDMAITPYLDERKDFWKSTIGAIRKLKDNYRYFGDWYLSLAAYNAGIPRVKKAIQMNGGVKDYWDLVDKKLLPQQTCHYVPMFLAMVKLASNKSKFGLPVLWDDLYLWERVSLDRTIDLRLLAKEAELPLDQFLAAHRELNHPITPGKDFLQERPYYLKVPVLWLDRVKKVLANPHVTLLRTYSYTIQEGDTVSEIAQWYGVDMSTIVKYNKGLVTDKLKVHQVLVIPAVKDGVADFQKSKRIPENSEIRLEKQTYTVQRGDSFYSLARKVGITPLKLAEFNHLSLEGYLLVGQELVFPPKVYAP